MLRLGGGRTMTILAVGLLVLDGLLLVLAGIWTRSPWLGGGGAALLLVAGLIALYYRRYQRQLEAIERSREELREQIGTLRELLRRREEGK